jgi:DinB superfamily
MSTQEASFASAAVKAFKLNLDRSTKFFSALTPEQFETRIAPGKNRLIYLYGHLIAVNDAMFPLLGIGERLHPELDEIFLKSPDGAASSVPPVADLTAAWNTINQKLLAAFDTLTPAQWLERHTSVSEEDFAKDPSRNRLAILLSRTSHLAYHMGQAVLAPK